MVGRRCGPGRSTASPFGPDDAQAAREITIKREKKARRAGLGIEGFTCYAVAWSLQARMARSRAIRSSMGGWVEKSLNSDCPLRGFTINRCEVAGLASIGRRWAPTSSFCKAEANAFGLWVS